MEEEEDKLSLWPKLFLAVPISALTLHVVLPLTLHYPQILQGAGVCGPQGRQLGLLCLLLMQKLEYNRSKINVKKLNVTHTVSFICLSLPNKDHTIIQDIGCCDLRPHNFKTFLQFKTTYMYLWHHSHIFRTVRSELLDHLSRLPQCQQFLPFRTCILYKPSLSQC